MNNDRYVSYGSNIFVLVRVFIITIRCVGHWLSSPTMTINWHRSQQSMMDVVVDLYRQMEKIDQIFTTLFEIYGKQKCLSLGIQETLIHELFCTDFNEQYAPRIRYQLQFLKRYYQLIERQGGEFEISDRLMKEYLVVKQRLNAMSVEDMSDLYHLSYRIEPQTIVTCRVAGICNQVGFKIWEASFLMTEYCLAHAMEFHDKHILELGSGVGFTGLAMAKSSHVTPASIHMTDYVSEVLTNCRYNLEINQSSSTSMTPVKIQAIDWYTWTLAEAREINADVLLAADCVYDIANFDALVSTLVLFFQAATDARQHPAYAIFASTVRNHSTFERFILLLDEREIQYEEIHWTQDPAMTCHASFPYETRHAIRLYRLSRNKRFDKRM